MNYKDRKQAKRTYKQMLLVTSAALTLGLSTVSTFGGTISVYAAEENTTQKKFWIDEKGELKFNDSTIAGLPMVTKVTGSLLGNTIKDGNMSSADLQNAFRDLSIGITGMIPYGGAFVSSILSTIWPISGQSQMQKMMEQVSELIDEKIETYDGSTLRQDFNSLQEELQRFENGVNGVQSAKAPNGASNAPQDRIADAAQAAERHFRSILKQCQKDGLKEAELPLFTTIATAHLLFLQFMDKNHNDIKIQIDDASFKTFFTNPKDAAKEYKEHISKTSPIGQQKFVDKMKKIKGALDNIDDLQGNINHINLVNQRVPGSGMILATQEAEQFTKLFIQRLEYIKATEKSDALNLVLESVLGKQGWNNEGDKWYYFESGVKATGWHDIQGQTYYLSPADGALVTGLRTIDGHLYDFKSTSATSASEAPKGSMLTGWQFEEDAWFYFNPEEGGPKGAAKTGWFKSADNNWYYLDPNNEGAAFTGKGHTINGKKYDFNDKGTCTTPNGY